MATVRHKADLGDGLGVVFVCVDEFLRDEVLLLAAIAGQLDVEVYTTISS